MMEGEIFGNPAWEVVLVIGILVFFIVLESLSGYLLNSKRKAGDWLQETVSYFVLALFTKPGIVFSVMFLGTSLAPDWQNALDGVSMWLVLPVYLLVDDFLQYWYHRFAHEYPFLWKLHRPHHQAEEMGFFVSYRNAGLYYLMMPNIWWIGICAFLGGGLAVSIGLVLKQLIIIGSHSRVHYDLILYRYKWLHPVATVWERIFITPAFHHAHHGKSKADGVSDPNGNFGNMFSIWDQLFGSALYTREFPSVYGLENDPKEPWTTTYLYPILASDDPDSELSRGHKKVSTATPEPTVVQLEAGKNYLWCQCGMSKSQPFCDGAHHGTKHKPLLFKVKKDRTVKLCNCKLTKSGPFCDNSHLESL